jgi:hypothetical protein
MNILPKSIPTALYEIASVSLFPNPPQNGIISAGNKFLTFFKAAILNIYGFL